ncbi:MAG: BatA domain-containing protein, partial [Thermoguttaceae bacterium]|nr:BatA domain-containing protein [Thermoguttaceae bacterium]
MHENFPLFYFLHPLFLTALVCVAAPVLLHFLMRPKPKKLTFPAFRFLQSHEKSQRRSLRLKHWLLL